MDGNDVEALYRAVFAAPADDGPRLVLADALQEQGDPRGEFISLQLQTPRSQRSDRRMHKLLDRHRTQFLRRLHSAVMPDENQRWERGFLTEASVMLHGDLVEAPDWATLRKLEVLFSGTPPVELASRHFRSLKDVARAPLQAVPVLFGADHPLGLESVALQGPPDLSSWPAAEVELIGQARSLPSLARLTLHCQTPNFAEADWVWRMPVLSRIKSLEFLGSFRGVPLEAMLSRVRHAELSPANLIFHASSMKVRVKREDRFRSLMVELQALSGVQGLDAMLRSIPADAFDEVLITSIAPLELSHVATLKRALKRLELRNVSLPLAPQGRMK